MVTSFISYIQFLKKNIFYNYVQNYLILSKNHKEFYGLKQHSTQHDDAEMDGLDMHWSIAQELKIESSSLWNPSIGIIFYYKKVTIEVQYLFLVRALSG
jgi:hypothetical protein